MLSVYRSSEAFPKEEIYGLTSQFRRAAISVPANMSEGFKKTVKADKCCFMNIAQGSLEECRHYVILSRDLGYFLRSDVTLIIMKGEDEMAQDTKGLWLFVIQTEQSRRLNMIVWEMSTSYNIVGLMKEALDSNHLLLEMQDKVLIIPFQSIKSIEFSPPPEKLPEYALRNVRIVS